MIIENSKEHTMLKELLFQWEAKVHNPEDAHSVALQDYFINEILMKHYRFDDEYESEDLTDSPAYQSQEAYYNL